MSDQPPPFPLAEPPQGERSPRTNLLLSATIEAEGIAAPVRIRNLSETGALLEGAALPAVGARLILRRLHLEIGGTVVWSADSRCGVRFEGTISVAGWRSGTWMAPNESHQHRVDGIQAAMRAGSFATGETRADRLPAQSAASAAEIDARIARELTALRDLLENMGEQLSDEPAVVQHHPGALQGFDLACQILGHLAQILAAENRGAAIDRIGMVELRERLRAKAGCD
jgi:hypothetical protein